MQLRVYDTAGDALRVGYDATHYVGVSVSSAGVIAIKESGTERGRISGGVLAWGTTVTTDASAGDVVLPQGAHLRAANGAGTGSYSLIRSNSNQVQIAGDDAQVVLVGTPIATGAGGGDVVLGNGKWLYGANAAGTGLVPMVRVGFDNVVELGAGVRFGGATATILASVTGASPCSSDLASLTGCHLVVAELIGGGSAVNEHYRALYLVQSRAGLLPHISTILASDAPGNNDGGITLSGTTLSVAWGGSRTGKISAFRLN